ncbi:MAG: hypothetical protein U9R53_05185 [Chloroflexota bacterium]|nr:hypothetical protein [Chloroflexota bacterium]
MTAKKNYSKIAAALVGGEPLDFSLKADGTLVVIAPNGQKFKFSPEQVEAALPKPTPKPKPKSQARRGRPPKVSSEQLKVEST